MDDDITNATGADPLVVYWPEFCGNQSEDWAFWSDSISVNTSLPDFTLCFQSTVLVWIPCGFLWLMFPIYVAILARQKTLHRCGDAGKLNLLKVILGIFLCFISLLDLFRALSEHTQGEYQYPVIYVSSGVYFITYVLTTWLAHYEYRKGVHSSGVLWIFWFLSVLCAIVPFRSFILHTSGAEGEVEDMFRFVVFYVNFALVLIQFILVWFSDTSALPSERRRKEQDWEGETAPLLGSSKNKPDTSNGPPHEPCPELKTPFFSRITYWWITRLIIKGYKKSLVFNDLWDIRPQERSDACYEIFEKEWRKEMAKCEGARESTYQFKNKHGISETMDSYHNKSGYSRLKEVDSTKPLKKTPSMTAAFFRGYGAYYLLGGFCKLIYDTISFIQPQILSLLIAFVSSNDPYQWHGYLYGVVLFLAANVKSFANQQYSDVCYKFGIRVRSAVIAAVYRKALRLSSSARRNTTQGEIVNLMSVDAQKLQDAPVYLHFLWSAPVTIIVCLVLLWQILGPAVLAGLGVLILMIPINAVIAGKIKKYQALRLSSSSRRKTTQGEIVNLMSVDAQKLQDVPVYLHYVWSAPITVIVCLVLLWQYLGPAVFAGLAVLLLLIPVNAAIAGKIKKYQTSQMKHKDSRLKVMNEVLNGIKVLKLYAWEPSFEDKVNGIRDQEISDLKKAAYLNALTSITWFVAPTLVALASFAVYSYMDPNNYLDAQVAFVSLSYFNVMNFPLTILPAVIAYVVQASVSVKRLTKFLILEELDEDSTETDHSISEPIAIENGTFSWGRDDPDVLKK